MSKQNTRIRTRHKFLEELLKVRIRTFVKVRRRTFQKYVEMYKLPLEDMYEIPHCFFPEPKVYISLLQPLWDSRLLLTCRYAQKDLSDRTKTSWRVNRDRHSDYHGSDDPIGGSIDCLPRNPRDESLLWSCGREIMGKFLGNFSISFVKHMHISQVLLCDFCTNIRGST